MKYSKEKALGNTQLCMCSKGKLWIDGKDITDKLVMLGVAENVIRRFGTKEQLKEYKAKKKEREED